MRRIYHLFLILVAVLALGSFSAFGQKVSLSIEGASKQFPPLDKSHEVRLNLLSSTLFLRPEVAYEYTINKDFSVGGRAAVALSAVGIPNQSLGGASLMPYGRWHFYRSISNATSGTSLRGFFVELHLSTSYYSTSSVRNPTHPEPNTYERADSGLGLGLGLGLGYKWITPGAWTFELGTYLGRNVVSPAGWNPFYGNYLVSIGKRF